MVYLEGKEVAWGRTQFQSWFKRLQFNNSQISRQSLDDSKKPWWLSSAHFRWGSRSCPEKGTTKTCISDTTPAIRLKLRITKLHYSLKKKTGHLKKIEAKDDKRSTLVFPFALHYMMASHQAPLKKSNWLDDQFDWNIYHQVVSSENQSHLPSPNSMMITTKRLEMSAENRIDLMRNWKNI